jgi:hypothetical protein
LPTENEVKATKVATEVQQQKAEVFRVLQNLNGVLFLRVTPETATGAYYVINRGAAVELVQIAKSTVKQWSLLPLGNVRETAQKFLHPLNAAVTISAAARAKLLEILEHKELNKMETAIAETKTRAKFASVAPAKKAKKGAAKAAKPAKVKATQKAPGERQTRISDDTTFTPVKSKIDTKLQAKLDNKDCNTHGVVVMRVLLKTGGDTFAKIVKAVTATGKYSTEGKEPSKFILGDLRIFAQRGLVTEKTAAA